VGRRALAQVACVAKPDTILRWYQKLIAKKFDCASRKCRSD
jgi:putative transposase